MAPLDELCAVFAIKCEGRSCEFFAFLVVQKREANCALGTP